jgi:aerotaxis receptor
MKNNQPVTQVELRYPQGRYLVSKTDLKGAITYANDTFVELSGFSLDELVGKNHNIVRHPDMPPQAFEDLWRTIKAGLPWTGIVKNRSKTGDFYWVKAFVVPIRENGAIVGYMSVRSEPSRAEIDAAATLYRKLNETRAPLDTRPPLCKRVTIRARLVAIMSFVALMLAGGAIVGLGGVSMSNDALHSTYRDKLEPVDTLWKITALMNENRGQVMLALQHNPTSQFAKLHDHPLPAHTDAIIKNRDEITALWEDFSKREFSAAEKAQAEKYVAARSRYVAEGLMPARQALLDGQYEHANELLLQKVNPLYREAAKEANTLLDMLKASARQQYDDATARYRLIRNIGIGGTLAALAMIAAAALVLLRSIVAPLESVMGHFSRISEGDLTEEIDISGRNEVGLVLTSLAATQVHLKVMLDEINAAAAAIEQQSYLVEAETGSVAEKSEQQRDRVQSVAAATEEFSQSVREVADSAGGTASAAETAQTEVATSHASMTQSMAATERVVAAVQTSSQAITELDSAIAKIGTISQTIKEIADQTNLLALNAAIEAARAGEQGRGFAVVADEVRKLAERTTSSTADITATVAEIRNVTDAAVASMDNAVAEVEQGTSLIRQSGESLSRITAASTEVNDRAQHIASAAKEQASASEQVASNMEHIATLIDGNVTAAHQAQQAADDLLQTAGDLRKVVSQFRLVRGRR